MRWLLAKRRVLRWSLPVLLVALLGATLYGGTSSLRYNPSITEIREAIRVGESGDVDKIQRLLIDTRSPSIKIPENTW